MMLEVHEERTGTPPSENTPVEAVTLKKKIRKQAQAIEHTQGPGPLLASLDLWAFTLSSPRKQRQALSGLVTPILRGQTWPGPRLVAGPGIGDITPQAPAPGPRHLPQIRFSFLITAVMGPSDLIPALDII